MRAPVMTEIVFLRHFETDVDEDVPAEAWELSAAGTEAMRDLLQSDIVQGIDRVYSSPEHKALRTARAVAETAGIPLEAVDALREVDRSGEGFIEDHDEYIRMVRDYLQNSTVPYQWENREAVEDRIRTFLETVDTRDDRVMAVTHGMFLSTLIPRVRGTDPFTFWKELGFGAIITADHEELVTAMGP